jgi:hypothetical protein
MIILLIFILVICLGSVCIAKRSLPFLAIDFSTTYSLHEDKRVHELHKKTYPDVCHEYVLWRVNHDGSCWNSVGITWVIYQMIQGGEDIFDNAIERFKTILKPANLDKSEKKIIIKFFAILDRMRQKMDHRYSLELRNYSNIYKTLDKGFRIILATQERQNERPDYEYADEIEQPGSRGHMSNMRPLLADLGFSYAGIDCFHQNGEFAVIKSSLEEYLDPHSENSLRESNAEYNKNIIDKMPTVLAIGSSPDYADIAVKKSFAHAIRESAKKPTLFSGLVGFNFRSFILAQYSNLLRRRTYQV